MKIRFEPQLCAYSTSDTQADRHAGGLNNNVLKDECDT